MIGGVSATRTGSGVGSTSSLYLPSWRNGRRSGLKIRCRETCGFESHRGYLLMFLGIKMNKKVDKRIKICKKLLRKYGFSKKDINRGAWSFYKNNIFRKTWIVLYYVPSIKTDYIIKGFGDDAHIIGIYKSQPKGFNNG